MKVRYTETAIADIEEIFSQVFERNARSAVAVIDAIEATVARLGTFPYSAPRTDEPDIRMAPAQRYPYLIFYRIGLNTVEIVRVLHAARRRPWEQAQDEENEK